MGLFQPPYINGVMSLDEEEKQVILDKLSAIAAAFTPTYESPACDVFYLVSTYNKENPGAEINGDTAKYLLD